MIKKAILLMSMVLAGTWANAAAPINHDFEADTVDSTTPGGFGVFGHELLDRGITTSLSATGAQSAFVVVDFTQDSWGVIMTQELAIPVDLTGTTLSVQVRADKDVSKNNALVGFQLVDADGTTVRTATDSLYRPGQKFSKWSAPVAAVSLVTEGGADSSMDYSKIKKYGLLFLDRGDCEEEVVFHVDDYTAKAE